MNELTGRRVMKKELTAIEEFSKAIQLPAMEITHKRVSCCRCGSIHEKSAVHLSSEIFFCPSCIQMGRVDSTEVFYHLPEPETESRKVVFSWNGTLTDGQKVVSDELRHLTEIKKNGMVWAVTGAGKTEMLFETLHALLEKDSRICIASPRVDVCLELFPRIKAVFPFEDILLLHGKVEELYRYTKLVVCTTHQLLRFYQAFDLLIIDEVDAFPYIDEEILHRGAQNALKEEGSLVYLTATPTKKLLNEMGKGQLATIVLPARYHRRVLPVPIVKRCAGWYKQIKKGFIPKELKEMIRLLVAQNNILLFCPSIKILEMLYPIINKEMKDLAIEAVHSKDEKRLEKVQGMRAQKFRLFLTTTILERGVTFERVSVIVLGAERPVFTESVLVQIAGRVDRKAEFTNAKVYFLCDGQTKAVKTSIYQIKKMNQLARKRGLIDELFVL
ncbi:DEAD/DEAH box helicase [Enterococcus sp. LJL128]|uniref:DEAD/DEAH box helicase n=1 Tax=Enterococcus sp. LJL51 TaxID=3416656 RepID=UPI003CFBA56C